ncbi:Cox17 copper metallochaperone [Candida orthopsilosis Co 90-125]|uniref:Cox17 copper metallochaperone n=1 Tax=Candida orthopsilosis (strain 90-125) TaxID=1136231 RepID=H8WXM3_CANO9|nr:Cox17 copper metallochaperone [Candida orthopsilosis Co 90-125]CCG21696.1 Cox17 copper metallochaperone [Candida orthopsilosis Co 90-125]
MSSSSEQKPKPCCVCLDERKERDKCVLFHGVDSEDCKSILDKYTSCMKGYGFTPNPIKN